MTFALVPFTADRAALVAGWVRDADEADRWCSRAEHPFPATVVSPPYTWLRWTGTP